MSNLVTERVLQPRAIGLLAARAHRRRRSRDLIGVQEEERRRISQELHDDLGQRLALVEIKIHQLEQHCLPAGVAEGLKTVRGLIADLDRDIHRICYELYPVVLEKLGLIVALRSLCRDFSDSSGILTYFDDQRVPQNLPKNVSLSLYRVTQEALQNVSKHAKAKKARVVLREVPEGIEVVITDSGIGFDPLSIRARKGLGLIAMEDRVLSVGGCVSIRSSPGEGTEVRVLVHLGCQGAVAS
jgi:signal transduction histidine kinase